MSRSLSLKSAPGQKGRIQSDGNSTAQKTSRTMLFFDAKSLSYIWMKFRVK